MKKSLSWIVLISWVQFFPFPIFPQTSPTEKFWPDDEKRSAIVEAHGYAYLSEDKTIKALRQEAYADAKRQAAEIALTQIQGLTKVENFTLTYDLIQTQAEGAVKVLEHKDGKVKRGALRASIGSLSRARSSGFSRSKYEDGPFVFATSERASVVLPT